MQIGKATVEIAPDADAMARLAADTVVKIAQKTVEERGTCRIALSGGATPKRLYTLLADRSEPFRTAFPWHRLHLFFGDERHVPPSHADSNFRVAREAMLAEGLVPRDHVFRIRAENTEAAHAASDYERTLKREFQVPEGIFPRFDLVLLGLGQDGHTASLFPESEALKETRRYCVANWVEAFRTWRITLTFPVLNRATNVVFLVSGEEKAFAVNEVLKGARNVTQYPAQGVAPDNGKLLWLLDAPAAKLLN